mmetsp:Transcript_9954/g.24343  ORF Transcript_9954/g.24343 Transcript_9954/m.24343 type:complete len:95 (+) Transcript_9954:868-1152(+)
MNCKYFCWFKFAPTAILCERYGIAVEWIDHMKLAIDEHPNLKRGGHAEAKVVFSVYSILYCGACSWIVEEYGGVMILGREGKRFFLYRTIKFCS